MASASGALAFQQKQAERMKKLRELHSKRNEARQLNHQEVVEEDKRKNLPSNWEARKRRAEWIMNDEKKRREAEEEGGDYDRVKLLNIGATEAELLERKKKKKNPDTGFADYEQATIRQYNRLVKNVKPDMEQYNQQREKLGEAFYGGRNTILHGLQEDTKEGIDRMVEDLEKHYMQYNKKGIAPCSLAACVYINMLFGVSHSFLQSERLHCLKEGFIHAEQYLRQSSSGSYSPVKLRESLDEVLQKSRRRS